jgi:hypothetical protein
MRDPSKGGSDDGNVPELGIGTVEKELLEDAAVLVDQNVPKSVVSNLPQLQPLRKRPLPEDV